MSGLIDIIEISRPSIFLSIKSGIGNIVNDMKIEIGFKLMFFE